MTNWIKALARRILGKELRLLKNSLALTLEDNDRKDRKVQALETQNAALSQQLSDRPHITEYKITKEIYQKHIVDRVPGALMNSTVTAQHTGYLLGVQATLNVVRELVQ